MAVTPTGRPVELELETQDLGRTRTLTLRGEIDLASAPALRGALAAALWDGDHETLVVDLADVGFVDSSGIAFFLDAHTRSRAEGVRLVLLPGPPAVQHVFEICGVLSDLPFSSQAEHG